VDLDICKNRQLKYTIYTPAEQESPSPPTIYVARIPIPELGVWNEINVPFASLKSGASQTTIKSLGKFNQGGQAPSIDDTQKMHSSIAIGIEEDKK